MATGAPVVPDAFAPLPMAICPMYTPDLGAEAFLPMASHSLVILISLIVAV